MDKSIDLIVIGDAMVDVVLPLSDIEDISFLSQGGVTNTRMSLSPGGAANVAYYMSKLGGRAAFTGRIGDDHYGRLFAEDLKKHGIIANITVDPNENTGVVHVLVFPSGERFFIDDRGANVNLAFEDIDLNLVEASRFLYFLGYSFQDEKAIGNIIKTLDSATGDTQVVFNPGAPNLADSFREAFTDIIRRHVDILILNEAEARCLTQCDSNEKMLASLLALTDIVALTRGEQGSIVANKDETHIIEAIPVGVIDTTGAGDAYSAGLIYGLCQGCDLKTAGEFASRIASKVVTHLGARVDISE
ncbi:MAG TPA: adenosine kinase [Dehalococcoidia bacterium]|nr:adenosine kinase [Dehalococcoidia bacterium]